MSRFVLTNVRLFTGGADLTGNSNKVELTSTVDDKETTNYASGGWKELIGGLAASEINAGGQWEALDPSKVDDNQFGLLGGIGPWTIGPADALVGNLAYFTNALDAKYMLGGAVGEVAPWEGSAKSTWPTVRGVVAHPPGTPRTTTGTGTGQQVGAVAAGKQFYAALHVLSVAGTGSPTITVAVESDTSGAFAGPTTRLTFAAATALGGQILRTPGAITDTWWRPKWTISGSSPSFLFVAAFGIA